MMYNFKLHYEWDLISFYKHSMGVRVGDGGGGEGGGVVLVCVRACVCVYLQDTFMRCQLIHKV